MHWWCTYWKRPFKDPLLQSYTFEELMYEFHSIREHEKAEVERTEQKADKIEEDKEAAVKDWADKLEAEELEAEKLQAEKASQDPAKDPANVKWMQEQIALQKEEFGEEFGEDVNLDFGPLDKKE